MKPFLTFIFVTMLFASCDQAPDQQALKAAIEKANAELSQAFANKDADAVVSHYTTDARLMFPNMPAIEGREKIKGLFEQVFNDGVTGLTLAIEDVKGTDEFAIESGRYEMFVGDQKVDEGKYLVEWKNVDGKWLLHRDMPSTDLPAAGDSAVAE